MNANIRKLQYLPYGTKEHDRHLRSIQKEIKSRDFVLCMRGKFMHNRNVFADNNVNAMDVGSVGMTYNSVFPGNQSVYESKDFFFVRRDQAEYNLDYRQVNVGVLVMDNNNKVLVLRKTNGFLSLVGGHTDFVKDSYDMSVKQLTHFNIVKEFKEEVKTNLSHEEIPEEPLFFVTEGHEMWDFLHAWFVYIVHVDDLDSYTIESGEKTKHETVVIDIDTALADTRVKNSLRQALTMYKTATGDVNNKPTIKVSTPEETGKVEL